MTDKIVSKECCSYCGNDVFGFQNQGTVLIQYCKGCGQKCGTWTIQSKEKGVNQ